MLDGISDAGELCNYINRESDFFYSNKEWLDGIKGCNFSIGSRFHGNVMGLRAGFKSLFLTTDSRTKEMVSFFNLPHMSIKEFSEEKNMDYYYDKADYSEFNKKYSKIFDGFTDFLRKNGMDVV